MNWIQKEAAVISFVKQLQELTFEYYLKEGSSDIDEVSDIVDWLLHSNEINTKDENTNQIKQKISKLFKEDKILEKKRKIIFSFEKKLPQTKNETIDLTSTEDDVPKKKFWLKTKEENVKWEFKKETFNVLEELSISIRSIKLLQTKSWLNDDIVNGVWKLIEEASINYSKFQHKDLEEKNSTDQKENLVIDNEKQIASQKIITNESYVSKQEWKDNSNLTLINTNALEKLQYFGKTTCILSTYSFAKIQLCEGESKYHKADRILKRRSKKFKLINRFIFPINLQNHWLAAWVSMENQTIEIYNSYSKAWSKSGTDAANSLKLYFDNSLWVKEELQKRVNISEEKENIQTLHETNKNSTPQTNPNFKIIMQKWPQQTNNYDCGVFTCLFIYSLAKSSKIVINTQSSSKKRKFLLSAITIPDILLLDQITSKST